MVSEIRDYQVKDLANIFEAFETSNSVLYQLPTGGGKSHIIKDFIRTVFHGEETIVIFVHKLLLIEQLIGHIESLGFDYGVMSGTKTTNLDAKILIVSIATAVRDNRLDFLKTRKIDYVITDEARHTRRKSYDTVFDELIQKDTLLLGVDATPYRKDKKDLRKHFDTLVISTEDVESLTKKGYLQACKVILAPFDTRELNKAVSTLGGDYQVNKLSEFMRKPEYLNFLVNQYNTYGEGRQNIIFAVDINHSIVIKEVFEANGYDGLVGRVDSNMTKKEIQSVYEQFKKGEIQHLINVDMITEGADFINCGCITGARPTKSLTLFLQMIGRGGRPDGIHDYFILLDNCGWTIEYGTMARKRNWSLNPEIDPNGNVDGKILIGRDKNGSIITDLYDFEGEVEEVDEDEFESMGGDFIAKMKSKKQKTIDSIDSLLADFVANFNKILLDIESKFPLNSKDARVSIKTDIGTIYSECSTIDFEIKTSLENNFITFTVRLDYESECLKISNNDYSINRLSVLEASTIYQIVGNLSKGVADLISKGKDQKYLTQGKFFFKQMVETDSEITAKENEIKEVKLNQAKNTLETERQLEFKESLVVRTRLDGYYFHDISKVTLKSSKTSLKKLKLEITGRRLDNSDEENYTANVTLEEFNFKQLLTKLFIIEN